MSSRDSLDDQRLAYNKDYRRKLHQLNAERKQAIHQWALDEVDRALSVDFNYEIDPQSGLTLHYLPDRVKKEIIAKLKGDIDE